MTDYNTQALDRYQSDVDKDAERIAAREQAMPFVIKELLEEMNEAFDSVHQADTEVTDYRVTSDGKKIETAQPLFNIIFDRLNDPTCEGFLMALLQTEAGAALRQAIIYSHIHAVIDGVLDARGY